VKNSLRNSEREETKPSAGNENLCQAKSHLEGLKKEMPWPISKFIRSGRKGTDGLRS